MRKTLRLRSVDQLLIVRMRIHWHHVFFSARHKFILTQCAKSPTIRFMKIFTDMSSPNIARRRSSFFEPGTMYEWACAEDEQHHKYQATGNSCGFFVIQHPIL